MGKRAKRIIEKISIKKKTLEVEGKFLKNLLSILPLVILLVVSINIFIFYYIPSKEGLIFLYNLFGSGNLIVLSAFGVFALLLPLQLLITKKFDRTVSGALTIYIFISGLIFGTAPSIQYTMLLSNRLSWTGFLIIDYVWEFMVIYFIYYAIKKFRQKALGASRVSK